MSLITLDFNTLKFNLYEILSIDSNASDSKIKKAFRNLILNFHPDKNNEAEEEIYYHIITANQILTNPENRKKYDEYLNKKEDTHDQLKNKFNNLNNQMNNQEKKEIATRLYYEKIKELEKKHLSEVKFDENISEKYNKIVQSRQKEINIPNENIKTTRDFNDKFEERITNGKFSDQLIPVTENMQLSTYNVNDNYTSLDIAFDNLYIDGGGITTSKFTSLDTAFKLQSINTKKVKDVNIKESIDRYKNETNNMSKIEYTKTKYELW
jgi:curved DNA-binding protein CbpA